MTGSEPARDPRLEPSLVPALDPDVAALLRRDGAGLVAAVVQQFDDGQVLMVGWMDDEALRRTLTEGRVTFYSRSRRQYWRKGDTSGHRQWVKAVAVDCDGDALLVTVDQEGAACHTGSRTCFATDLPVVPPPSSRCPSSRCPSSRCPSSRCPLSRESRERQHHRHPRRARPGSGRHLARSRHLS